MMVKRMIVTATLVVGIFTAVPTVAASTAQAVGDGANSCDTTAVCGWKEDSYTGLAFHNFSHIHAYTTVSWDGASTENINDKLSSVASRFTRCWSRWYQNENESGHVFELSYPSIGGTYQDPNMTNGAGVHGNWSDNWDNRVSSHTEITCS